ncbi:hypothetical protein PoB_007400600 [Plakobranchus ocellatus]|uniref:G-protein coupled receptors family 1 profile domain-containing protein n=1 Tax=Plakobranchus ocellatus TaxID=259542 RepID=A0AAV4DUB9_9GAST|nr:hypothetical protein PoB_007400600 [Plakobranchus ocellatus]
MFSDAVSSLAIANRFLPAVYSVIQIKLRKLKRMAEKAGSPSGRRGLYRRLLLLEGPCVLSDTRTSRSAQHLPFSYVNHEVSQLHSCPATTRDPRPIPAPLPTPPPPFPSQGFNHFPAVLKADSLPVVPHDIQMNLNNITKGDQIA